MSLKDVWFALGDDGEGGSGTWSLRRAVIARRVWPPLSGDPAVSFSLREVLRRFAAAGRELRVLADESGNVWRHIGRADVVRELRDRIRDPAIMRQSPTDLCGPFSILMEFARRHPARFVKGAAQLLRAGVFITQSGRRIEAPADLRGRPLPSADLAAVEWMYAATMRDEENITDDVDDAEGLEGLTWPGEMNQWTADVLGLRAEHIACMNSGELEALRAGERAVERGGVAFLLIEADLLKNGENDGGNEEKVWWRRARHHPGGVIDSYPDRRTHSVDDDNVAPDHYVVLLGGVRGAHEGEHDFRAVIWSYGSRYEITGHADGFAEYLYGVIVGEP